MTNSAPLAKRHNFTGNDVATSFSYTKKISDQDHIMLVHTDTAGLENALADPLVVDVDYTVNGVGDTGGGTVDFPKAGSVYSTLATGEKLSIIYNFPTEQQLDVPNTGRIFNVNVEDQLDYITNLISQAEELLDRALKLPEGSTLTDIAFPEGTSASNRASKIAAWNSAGTALELLAVSSVVNVDPIAVKGDIAQGDTNGDAAKLAIGGTGAILSVVSGLLAYTAIGSTNDVFQVIGGVPAWVTNPTIASPTLTTPTIADLSNMTHTHLNVANGALLFIAPTNYRSGFNCKQASSTTITVEGGVIDADGTRVEKTSDTTLDLTVAGDWVDDSSEQATNTDAYIYINASGKIEMDDVGPDASDSGDNTTGILRYYNTGTDTSWRRMIGWFRMNGTGSGELNNWEVGNLLDGDVSNSIVHTDGTNDTLDDTTYGSDLTNMTSRFYSSGRKNITITGHVTFSATDAGRLVTLEIHDGSDIAASEQADTNESTGATSRTAHHKENYAQGWITFDLKGKVDAGNATVADKTIMITEN